MFGKKKAARADGNAKLMGQMDKTSRARSLCMLFNSFFHIEPFSSKWMLAIKYNTLYRNIPERGS
jgi:hypothetical protein